MGNGVSPVGKEKRIDGIVSFHSGVESVTMEEKGEGGTGGMKASETA